MEIIKEAIIDKPVADVWQVLGPQYAEAYKWASGLYHSEGRGPAKLEGATCSKRTCETSLGKITEELETYDAANYRISYAVIEGFPSFVEKGVNNWKLEPMGDKTKVKMHLVVRTKGFLGLLMGPLMKMQMKGVTSQVLNDFKHYVENDHPSPRKAKEIKKQLQKVA